MTRKRTRNPDSPEAAYYFRELSAGRITPVVVERRIAELVQEAEDLEYFERHPERAAALRAMATEFQGVLGRDRVAAVARGVDEALATTTVPVAKPASSVSEKAVVVDYVPEKTHEGLRLDREEREEISSLLKQIRAERMTISTIRESLSNLRDQLPNVKNAERIHEIQTRIMILDEVAYLLKNPARKQNPFKGHPPLKYHYVTDSAVTSVHAGPFDKHSEAAAYIKRLPAVLRHGLIVFSDDPRKLAAEGHLGKEIRYKPNPLSARESKLGSPSTLAQARPQKNPDEDIRTLERKALEGDAVARLKWLNALSRVDSGRIQLRDEIIQAAARALFVDAWDSSEREEGRGVRGGALEDAAPDTIPSAFEAAEQLIVEFEVLNTKAVDEMYTFAAAALGKHYERPTPRLFGHYTAMQALGHGVSWSDDHPDPGFELPHIDFYLVPEDYGAEPCEVCRGGEDLDLEQEGDECETCRRYVYKGEAVYR
jgi:hypothetical protein